MKNERRICSRCVMDTTDPLIVFDEEGICNYCRLHDHLEKLHPLNEEGKERLEAIIAKIKDRGRGKPYDCVIGISGGTDSTYQLYLANKFGLRPLVVHFDNGWNSNIAVSNIEKATRRLGYDLHTYVVDWEEFKNLQVAFLKASTPDSEIPTDIAIKSTLYRVAAKEGIKTIIKGHSFRTEGRTPLLWSYGDGRYIKDVNRTFNKKRLRSFPNLTLIKLFYYTLVKRIKQIRLLYYVEYDKDMIKTMLKNEFDWKDYGGHHYESIYTRFCQGYILPFKFNIDKRKREFSALIRSRQMTRAEALEKIKQPPLSSEREKRDRAYVIKKLDLTEGDFSHIMSAPQKTFLEYKTYYPWISRLRKMVRIFYKLISPTTPLLLYSPGIRRIRQLIKDGKIFNG